MNVDKVTVTGLKPTVQVSSPKHHADKANIWQGCLLETRKKRWHTIRKNIKAELP